MEMLSAVPNVMPRIVGSTGAVGRGRHELGGTGRCHGRATGRYGRKGGAPQWLPGGVGRCMLPGRLGMLGPIPGPAGVGGRMLWDGCWGRPLPG